MQRPRLRHRQLQIVVRRRLHLARLQRELIPRPTAAAELHMRCRRHRARLVVDQPRRHRPHIAIHLRVERTLVRRIRPHRNSPVTRVAKPRLIPRRSRRDLQLQTRMQRRTRPLLAVHRRRQRRISPRHLGPVIHAHPVAAERSIVHQLRIQPALVRVIDLLGHQPIQPLARRLRDHAGVHLQMRHRLHRSSMADSALKPQPSRHPPRQQTAP